MAWYRRVTIAVVVTVLVLAESPGPAGAEGTLAVADGITVAYPAGWSVSPSRYTNAQELINVPAGDTGPGLGVARILITADRRQDHAEAVGQLKEIAAETPAPSTFLALCAWPAVQRRYLVPMEQPGLDPLPKEDREVSVRVTTAVAVDNVLVRMQGFVPPGGPSELADEIETIGRTMDCATQGDPEETATELEELRKQPSPAAPPLSTAASSLPAAPGAAAAASTGVPQQLQGGVGEIEIAVSTNGQNIVMGANSGFSNSTDGGATFTFRGGTPFPPGFFRVNGDPSLAFGQSGAFYYAFIGFPTGTVGPPVSRFTCTTTVGRSTNNGQSFTAFSNATLCANAGPTCFPDQEHIAADRVNAAPGGDQVYSVWRNFSGGNCDNAAGPVIPSIVCSQDNGVTWSAAATVIEAGGDYPRVTVAQDGFVYVVYQVGGNIRINKYSSCTAGLAQQAGFPLTVSAYNDVVCPVPGLDRCNNGNRLSSWMVAVDDTNANHVYVAYATNTVAGNEDVMLIDSTNGGSSWPNPAVRVNANTTGVRFMPWVCAVGGAARISWYDRRAAVGGATNDLTDYFCAPVTGSGAGLTPGAETNVSVNPDPQCASGWPCAPRSQNDSESCTTQPQLAGVCRAICATPQATDSLQPCDFTTGPACPVGELCCTGGGCPKYGDYNGNACAAGRVFNAWSSATAPPGLPAPGGLAIFFDSKLAGAAPDLSIAKADTPDPVIAGTNLTYQITVTNDASATALNVVVNDTVPANTTFVSAGGPGFTCGTVPAVGGTGPISCTLPFLAQNASAVLTIVVRVDDNAPDASTITNTATVSSQDLDPVPGNDSAPANTLVINQADLAVTKNATPDPVISGGSLTFAVEVTNNGPNNAVNAVFVDNVPANTTFQSIIIAAGWACVTPPVGGTGVISCTTPNFAANTSATFWIVVRVQGAVPTGTIISNNANISSDTVDPDLTNNPFSDQSTAFLPVPTLAGTGLLALIIVLLAVAVRSFRPRGGYE